MPLCITLRYSSGFSSGWGGEKKAPTCLCSPVSNSLLWEKNRSNTSLYP